MMVSIVIPVHNAAVEGARWLAALRGELATWPWVRRVVSWGFRVVLRLLFRLPASDTHGIKAWANTPAVQAELARVPATHHVYDTELVIRRIRAGARVVEIPITVRETRGAPRSIHLCIPRVLQNLGAVSWRSCRT